MIDEELHSTTTRFERKYRCTYAQYYAIKSAIYPYIQKDSYTQRAPKHKYLVRSLYFDTPYYQILFEKAGGNSDRLKYRIRTYSNSRSDLPDIRVEIKIREANLTKKFGAYTTIENSEHFLQSRHWQTISDPVLAEFERHTHLINLEPKTLVEYHREGYQTRDGSGTRITFDHRIRSGHSRELFPENILWHVHHEQMVVLELKHTNKIEAWFHRIAKTHGLAMVSNSKFAFGIQASQPDLIFPSWSDR